MTSGKGIYEELFVSGKSYPPQQMIHPLSPSDYLQALIHHSARQLEKRFQELAEQGRHDQILDLAHEMSRILQLEQEVPLSLPLSMILYRYDQESLPFQPDMFLSKVDLISNDPQQMKNFFKTLKFEMSTADSIDWMVSFIRMSGLQLLIRPLQELQDKGKRVRILTSLYMNVTEPKALRRLLQFPGVEVKVYNSGKESFHTKAYLFHRESGLNSILLGSSNLSHSALYNGHEWNVKIPDATYLPVYQQAKKKFMAMWQEDQAVPLTEELISDYERSYGEQRRSSAFLHKDEVAETAEIYQVERKLEVDLNPIQPNEMQKKALQALSQTRINGQDRGVIIAATGTGKTYLSALDVYNFQPRRLLFLAHREELLDHAKQTFENVFRQWDLCGKLTGKEKQIDSPFLFSTVQSLSRAEMLQKFAPDAFDYIIVDEFHHAQAATYRKIIDYFRPKFLLGLTATPERMDGKDVLRLCNHNVVYEIRLHDALEKNLLAPFHYFGLSDQTVDYDQIPMQNGGLDERALVQALQTHDRVDYVIEMIHTYGYDGERMIGLGFCVNVEHARFMSEEFNKRGFHTTFLTGEDTPRSRREVIRRLEDDQDPLQMIFTIDIFNEGIDIPRLNLVLFLRPTESSTIFIQQLGRGLRKAQGKEYVTILDFIGNYHKSFIVPLALSGQVNTKDFDQDSLRVAVKHEFADLPGASYVDLDPISRTQILNKIDQIRMDRAEMLKNLYQQFKKELGHSPEIRDFLYTEKAPSLHFFIYKYGSWVKTKQKMNDLSAFDQDLLNNSYALEVMVRLEQMFPVKWPYEWIVLDLALTQHEISSEDVLRRLQYRFGVQVDHRNHEGLIKRGMERLSKPYKKQSWNFGDLKGDQFIIKNEYRELMKVPEMREYIQERIDYGIIEFRRTYHPEQFLQEGKRFIRYQNYTRNDIIFLSGSTAQEGSWREGVAAVGPHYFLFVNLNKDQTVSEHLQYKDYFTDPYHFHWQSQNQTSHQSSRGQDYIHHKEKGIHIHLLVRKFDKMHGMTLPFTYLGEVEYVSSHGDQPMNIQWRLHHSIPEDLFTDLVC